MDLQKDGLQLSSSWLETLGDFSGSPIQAWNQISFGNFSSQEINAAPQNLTSSVPMFFPGENSVLREDPRTTQLLLNNTSFGAFGSLSPPPAPVTPGNNKFLQDERDTAGQRSILARGKEPITLCFDDGASELRSTEIETAEESNTPGVDFDKTPSRKPRRKKHRPKVIREGKPARTPNPSTPQKSTPRPPKPSGATPDNASRKRKYVRRNGTVNPPETPLTGGAEEVEARVRKESIKSAKRRLEFPPEDESQREESKSTAQEQEQKSSVINEVVDSCLTSLKILPSLQFQPSRRELIRWNLKKLARMRNGDLIQWLNRTPPGTPLSFESHPRFGFDFVNASNVVNTLPNDAMEVLKKKRTGRARCRISVNTEESEKVNSAEKEQHQAHGVDFSTASEGKNFFSLETIIKGIKSLDINSQPRSLPPDETALVPYTSGGDIVSYESLPLKKVRPKVNLDEETNRVWNFLMGKESNGVDRKDKEKWWEEERRVFRGRVDSFIAKMHLVQGDRRFSPWKGSVLDSVIGVFLTQNVSDHLSSSAFMAMAARFPPVSGKVNSEDTSLSQENSNTCRNPVVLEGQEEFKVKALSSSAPDLEVNVQEDFDSSKSDFFFSEAESLIVDENPYNLDSNISFMKLLEMATSRNLQELYSFGEDSLSNSERFPTPPIEESLKINRQVSKVNSENSVVNGQVSEGTNAQRKKKGRPEEEKSKPMDWDELRREACRSGGRRERRKESMDSLDWEAVKRADVDEISRTIRERGMNNMLAARIKGFLERLEKEHGSIDLEWLRDVPPEKAKDFLLSIKGLGLKSVECVRLLTLHHLAFPVDTNVGRICVRLGWVPLQPLPESLQLHLLELYPLLETIQKYLWPRLCTLDQRTLYELHYQMITFGKVFCTKSRPNCNACPLRAECRHFASAFASARLALPGPEERRLVTTSIGPNHSPMVNSYPLCQIEGNMVNTVNAVNPVIAVNAVNGFNPVSAFNEGESSRRNCEPIIEEPDSPEPESSQIPDIEDGFYEDPDEIPEIRLNIEEFSQNLQDYMQKNSGDLESVDFSKAMVMISQETASIPVSKLKNISRLRTEHQVYELPDSHYLLEGLDRREAEDPSPYLLAIWSPGETAQSVEPPESCGGAHGNGQLCDRTTCFSCNSMREAQKQVVRGTILIPCRTAMRGSFPLNGTYFQVNEVFADHESSLSPINVPRSLIWNLPRRTVYFGTSIPTIFRGLAIQEIQNCFWRGFVCVRGFDRKTRGPRPLIARLHFPASKLTGNKRTTQRGDE